MRWEGSNGSWTVNFNVNIIISISFLILILGVWYYKNNIYLKKLSFKPNHTKYFINLVNFSFENNLFLVVCNLLNPILWQKSYKDMISECS